MPSKTCDCNSEASALDLQAVLEDMSSVRLHFSLIHVILESPEIDDINYNSLNLIAVFSHSGKT